MDFTKLYQQYRGLWVALSANEKKVIAKGKDVKLVVKESQAKGIKIPYLFKVPTKMISYVSSGYEI